MLVLPERGHRIKGLPRTATGGPWSRLPHAGIGDVPKLPIGFQQPLKNSHPLTPPQARRYYYGEGREFFNLTYPIVCGDQGTDHCGGAMAEPGFAQNEILVMIGPSSSSRGRALLGCLSVPLMYVRSASYAWGQVPNKPPQGKTGTANCQGL